MARIRTIKPDFWTDEKIVDLSAFARLLFIGTWNFADEHGRGEFSEKRMKMQILPGDPVDIHELLGEIREAGLIEVYDVEGKQYFQIKGFCKHQKTDRREVSKFPPPQNSPEIPLDPPTSASGKERKGKERKGKEEVAPKGACRPAEPSDAQRVFEIYNETAKELGWPVAQAIKPRLSKINARLRECGGVDGWQAAMAKARASPFLSGSDGRSDGHENWRPDLDFFLQAKSFTKLMEGSYDGTSTPNKRESGHDRILRALAEVSEERSAARGGSVDSQRAIDAGPEDGPDQSRRILDLAAVRAANG